MNANLICSVSYMAAENGDAISILRTGDAEVIQFVIQFCLDRMQAEADKLSSDVASGLVDDGLAAVLRGELVRAKDAMTTLAPELMSGVSGLVSAGSVQ
jgi:predicted naringenin-chalcone synthase